MPIVRVKQGVQSTVFDESTKSFVTLVGGGEFDSNDPFVKANAWAFTTDHDAENDPTRRPARRTSAPVNPVEEATANPGEKRNR